MWNFENGEYEITINIEISSTIIIIIEMEKLEVISVDLFRNSDLFDSASIQYPVYIFYSQQQICTMLKAKLFQFTIK